MQKQDKVYNNKWEVHNSGGGHWGIKNTSERENSGLDANYYDLPKGATKLQDLIEYKDMNFSIGNIFKASYRLYDKGSVQYNLEKIMYYAGRELKRLKNENEI